jgi:class 3 adenylate cyclase
VGVAARLCARAEAGQILADARVAGALDAEAGAYRVERLETVEVKGCARPVTVYAVLSAANEAGPTQALA